MKALLLLLFIGFNITVAASLLIKIGIGCYRAWWPARKAIEGTGASARLKSRGWANAVWRNESAAQTT